VTGALAQDHPAPRRLLLGLCFQVHFGHYQQGSPIVPGILADSGAVAVDFDHSTPSGSSRLPSGR